MKKIPCSLEIKNLLSLLVLERFADLVKDGTVKEIDTARDQVGDERLGLLDVMKNLVGIGFGDEASKVVGRVAGDTGSKDRAQSTVTLVGLLHCDKGESASNIGMEDKDLIGVTTQDLVTEVIKTSCCSEGLIFTEVARYVKKVTNACTHEVAASDKGKEEVSKEGTNEAIEQAERSVSRWFALGWRGDVLAVENGDKSPTACTISD